ncbi:MAG: Fic family protein [Spirosomataceae bacterium]
MEAPTIYQQIKALKQELDSLRPLNKEQEGMIMQKFRLDWNYHSNHLEGNTLTYGETKALILFGLTAQGKPLKDHFEITGHDEAVKWIEEIVKQERPLTESFIRELHVLLLKESYEKKAISPEGIITVRRIEVGKYKKVPNHVLTKTGEMFYFASPEETPAKMGDLMEWYQKKLVQPDVEPILLATEFHYKFICIHPFDDGNGRTARLIMNFILMRFGYPPVIIKTGDKEAYFNVLRLADAGNLEPFVAYIAHNLADSMELMLKGAKGESIEEPDDLDKEISLLEQKLKGMSSGTLSKKSDTTVQFIYDYSYVKLCERFISSTEKFNKLYVNKTILLSIDQVSLNTTDITDHQALLDSIKSPWNKKAPLISFTKSVGVFFKYEALTLQKFAETVFIPNIFIEFDELFYAIRIFNIIEDKTKYGSKRFVKDSMLLEVKKSYTEQLTEDEINEIVNAEMKRHTAFIENKIKEITTE